MPVQNLLDRLTGCLGGRSHACHRATSPYDDEALASVLHGIEDLREAAGSLGCADIHENQII